MMALSNRVSNLSLQEPKVLANSAESKNLGAILLSLLIEAHRTLPDTFKRRLT